ncbi:MAG TPA: hypothetical protein VLM20_04105, partial [Methylophilaceae bacterium]|nr:hypothetical protein [Methylophilaceae bacterium]
MDTQFIFFTVLVFIASFFILEGVYYWWSTYFGEQAKKVKNRIDDIAGIDLKQSADLQSILKRRYEHKSNPIYSLFNQLRLTRFLDDLLMQSGVYWTYKKLFTIALAVF